MPGSASPPRTSRGVTRVLRLAFDRATPRMSEAADEPPEASDAPVALDFVAYADDCLLAGLIRLDADRLTDLLNEADEVELVDVVVQSIVSGAIASHQRLSLPRSDVLAVRAGPPRGRPSRRVVTVRHPVAVGVGRYTVTGRLHAPPDTSPRVSVARRGTIIPLTDASIRYLIAGEERSEAAAVLLVNRDRMDWLRILDEASDRASATASG